MENPNIERAGWSDEDRPEKEERMDEDDDSAETEEDTTTIEYLGT